MKLTKHQETEIIKVYDTWLNSYLNGDVKTYDSYLANEYRFIGSTNNEDFLNKTDTTKFFEATANQLAGKVEIRNSRRTLEKFDEVVFITDLFDAYFLSDEEWGYYGKFRFTSALKKNKEGWRFIYQHFSTPDSKAQKGETIGTEKITTENLLLREAVQRRTIELEQKSRELEIEAALEKIRSRSMAMHKSDELQEIVNIVFEKLVELKVVTDVVSVIILKENLAEMEYWVANSKQINSIMYRIIHNDDILILKDVMISRKSGLDFSKDYTFDEKNQLWEYLYLHSDFKNTPDERKKFVLNTPAYTTAVSFAKNTAVQLNRYYKKPFTDDEKGILKRITKVFEQTYTRFLDLQKAEAQARESQIQLALERVRARTMAMQKSDELQETAALLFMQVTSLGVPAFSCGFNIWEKGDKTFNAFMTGYENTIEPAINLPFNEEPNFKRFDESKRKGEDFYVLEMRGKAMQKHYQYLKRTVPVFREAFDKILEAGLSLPETQIHHIANFSKGNLMFITLEPCPEAHDIFKRFAKVFEQTFTRFLDLQKAEAQAREAQIEAALEKVRSRSLAMHSTNELGEVVTVIVEKLTELGVVLDANGVVLCTYFQNSKDVLHWIASSDFSFAGSYLLPWFDHPIFNDAWQSKESGEAYFSKAYSIEEKNSFFEYAFEHSDYRHFPDDFKQWVFQNNKHILSFAWQKNSAILIPSHTGVVPSENEAAILKRFAKVFEQAYVRFMDLQKAETQAREAQIEAALERVRSRTMGMQRSDELQEAAALMFQQIKSLGVNIMGCGFNIWENDRKEATAWMSGLDRIQAPFKTSSARDIFLRIYEAAQRGESLFTEEQAGKELLEHYKYMASIPDFKRILDNLAEKGLSAPSFQIMHCAFFSQGYLMFITHEPASNAYDIFKRFAKVFEQTYTRFLDLQKAEEQAREAIKQASLDRVRGEIASMRTKDDLNRITPLIWKELNALGVPFIRCGVFIMNEEKRMIQTYFSTPDGKSLTAFEMAYDSEEVAVDAVFHWNKKEIYQDHWDKKQFVGFMQNLIKTGQIKNEESFQGSSTPPESLDLHFVPFTQGMLYVGNTLPLNVDELQLVKSLAESFSIAYARYEDFRQLEEAKNQIEKTFTELKAAQAQLIQAEKMASLGELTAGIAHEIQNPLNFVNNFSELSNELMEEMKEELAEGSKHYAAGSRQSGEERLKLAEEIAGDIKQNLEKINHHGKRAADIVKGMLQHSRTSNGVKELTDINALADEYLRLAYHGLRAKDKSFNADFKTDFDPNLPKINVIPQDIGRVLLNLINNAFYAVQAPPPPEGGIKNSQSDYKPTVTVRTASWNPPTGASPELSGGRGALISVRDNGPGIPTHIVDKIFQPFFTTKPTGQGTGLGLSLSYDIVKAHGGSIKINSESGVFTEFIIQLPDLTTKNSEADE